MTENAAPAPVRAAIYGRVSTRGQAEDGFSLDDQERHGQNLIADHDDWTHVGSYIDAGRHGDREEQDELGRLLDDAADGKLDVIIAKAIDRLGRNNIEIEVTLKLLDDAGVKVFIGGRELDRETPEGNLHTDIEAIFAAYERRKIRKRTKDGLRERKEAGLPVGAMPFGFAVEEYIDDRGKAATRRIVDTAKAATVNEVLAMVGCGASPGEAARMLNRRGVTTRRGKTWTARAVRQLVRNDVYVGRGGYPRVASDGVWEHANQQLKRLDPVAVQARKGGMPASTDYLLRGIAFCRCGEPLYCVNRRYGPDRGRAYVCKAKLQSEGTCDAPAVAAAVAEAHVIDHLEDFVGDVEVWLEERAAEHSEEQAVREAAFAREEETLKTLDRKLKRASEAYDAALASEPDLVATALRQISRIEDERYEQLQVVADTEAAAAEWAGHEPDADVYLCAFFHDLFELLHGKVTNAAGAVEINRVLRDVLSSMTLWMDQPVPVLPDWESWDYAQDFDGITRLRAEFHLRVPRAEARAEPTETEPLTQV
jgi:DNA invertase Pin-like site-specific DNA recombinase